MSGRKRKIAERSSSSENGAPLSAFAAAKALKQHAQRPNVQQTKESRSAPVQEQFRDTVESLSGPLPERLPEDEPSSDYDTDDDEVSAPEAVARDVQLSTWEPSETNVEPTSQGSIVIHLKYQERACFIGRYRVLVKTGSVSILGAILRPESEEQLVYAPSTHALPAIVGHSGNAAILELREDVGNITDLTRLSLSFRRIWNIYDAHMAGKGVAGLLHRNTFSFLPSSIDDPLRRSLQWLDYSPWRATISQKLVAPGNRLRALVTGPKNSGKSTFAKILINSLLTAHDTAASPLQTPVFLLDLDPGQPEFAAPGQLSLVKIERPLLGPNYTHPAVQNLDGVQIVRSHALYSTSPAEDESHYLNIAKDLLWTFTASSGNQNLIVNCPGWLRGNALQVLSELHRLIRPTDFIYLGTQIPLELASSFATYQQTATAYHCLPAQQISLATRTAAELRAMQSLSYFHQDSFTSSLNMIWRTTALLERNGVELQYKESADMAKVVLGVLIQGEQPLPQFVRQLLEGTIVAIVSIDDAGYVSYLKDSIEHCPTTSIPLIKFADSTLTSKSLDPTRTSLLGFGLITNIDEESHHIGAVAPIGLEKVLNKNNLSSQKPHIVIVKAYNDIQSWPFQEMLQYDKARGHTNGNDRETHVSDREMRVEDLSIDSTQLAATFDELNSEDDDKGERLPWIGKLTSTQMDSKVFKHPSRLILRK